MKKILVFPIMIALMAVSCKKIICDKPLQNEEGDLRLRFENKSAEDLNNLTIGDRIIGDLSKGKKSHYFAYEQLMVEGDIPLLTSTATYEKREISGYKGFCGTGAETHTSGDFTVRINIITDFNDKSVLKLELK